MDEDVEIVAGVARVLAEKAGLVGFFDGDLHVGGFDVRQKVGKLFFWEGGISVFFLQKNVNGWNYLPLAEIAWTLNAN